MNHLFTKHVIKKPNEDNHKTKGCESNNNSESWVGLKQKVRITSPEQPVTQRFLQPALWLYF